MITDVKTTLAFSPQFHIRLKRFAEMEGKPMAQIVEEKLAPVMAEAEKIRLKGMYEGLSRLQGIIKTNIPDASTTIDEVVYDQNKGVDE